VLQLEAGLRLGGFGVSMGFVQRQEIVGETRFVPNLRFTWKYFDAEREPAGARFVRRVYGKQ